MSDPKRIYAACINIMNSRQPDERHEDGCSFHIGFVKLRVFTNPFGYVFRILLDSERCYTVFASQEGAKWASPSLTFREVEPPCAHDYAEMRLVL
jgi:hypothetical protein